MNKRTIARIARKKAKNARDTQITTLEEQIVALDEAISGAVDYLREAAKRVRQGGAAPDEDTRLFYGFSGGFMNDFDALAAKKAELAALKAGKPAPAEKGGEA